MGGNKRSAQHPAPTLSQPSSLHFLQSVRSTVLIRQGYINHNTLVLRPTLDSAQAALQSCVGNYLILITSNCSTALHTSSSAGSIPNNNPPSLNIVSHLTSVWLNHGPITRKLQEAQSTEPTTTSQVWKHKPIIFN